MFKAEQAMLEAASARARHITQDLENVEKTIREAAGWGRTSCTYKCYPYAREHLEDMLANDGYQVSKIVGNDGDKLVLTIYWHV